MPFIVKKMTVEKEQKSFLFLIKELGYSQKEAQRFISKGRLIVNGETITKASSYIKGAVEFIYFKPATKGLKPNSVFDRFVVFDKPSGVLVHPQNRSTPYSLIDELKYQFGEDANIAHRIDQETSGLVLCARDKASEKDIKTMFEKREVRKKYLAFVHGEFKNAICIEAPLLRKQDESTKVRMVVKVHKDGKASKTDVKPLKYLAEKDVTLVECSPHTGRQHQIRVHLFHVKHPIVGDPIYGQKDEDIVKFLDKEITKEQRVQKSGASRLMLHASELEFTLYGKAYHIKSDVDFLLY